MNSHEAHRNSNPFVTSAHATLHCLTGCVIGEVAGLSLAVVLGLGVWPTIILATTLAYLSGFFAAWPVNWWLLKRDLKNCH